MKTRGPEQTGDWDFMLVKIARQVFIFELLDRSRISKGDVIRIEVVVGVVMGDRLREFGER